MSTYLEISLPIKIPGAELHFKEQAEKELVERAKKDPAAFGALFDKYYDNIYNYVFHRVGNSDIADDITSDTFHKSLEKLWTFRWMKLPFSAWLYRIATNEVNGFYRKQKSNPRSELNEEVLNQTWIFNEQENKLSQENLFEQLRKGIENLNTKYQTVIVLRYFQEMTIKDICDITGKAEGTVKSLIHRGLKLLENEIDEELYKEFKNG